MIEIFDNSVEWWEYSPTNLSLYPSQWKNKIMHLPLPIAIHDTPWRCIDYKYDLLFCGGVSDRRLKILYALGERYKIKIIDSNFGYIDKKRLHNFIKKSKIILNLHSSEESNFEISRIHEALKFNKIIISEYPCKNELALQDKYADCADFIDIIKEDHSNIDQLYNKIEQNLENISLYRFKNSTTTVKGIEGDAFTQRLLKVATKGYSTHTQLYNKKMDSIKKMADVHLDILKKYTGF